MRTYPILLLVLVLIIFSSGCKKDLEIEVHDNNVDMHNNYQLSYQGLSSIEKSFFDLNRDNNAIDNRSDTAYNFIYSPSVLKLHAQILSDNQEHNFVTDLVHQIGLPLWSRAMELDISDTSLLVALPMVSNNPQDGVTGIITGRRNNWENSFYIDGISIDQLRNDSCLDRQEATFAIISSFFEVEIFHEEPSTLNRIDHLPCPCELQSNNPCVTRTFEICYDDISNSYWRGGISLAPFHIDHDQDGIANNIDQDWGGIGGYVDRYIEPWEQLHDQSWMDYIEEQWNNSYRFDEYGSFDDFWNDPYQYYIEYGPYGYDYYSQEWDDYHNDFYTDLMGMWDAMWGGLQSAWDWIFGGRDPDPLEDCPTWGIVGENAIDSRNIDCIQLSFEDCGQFGGDYWSRMMNGYPSTNEFFSEYSLLWSEKYSDEIALLPFINVMSNTDCNLDHGMMAFEQCVEWEYNQFKNNLYTVAINFYTRYGIDIPEYAIPDLIDKLDDNLDCAIDMSSFDPQGIFGECILSGLEEMNNVDNQIINDLTLLDEDRLQSAIADKYLTGDPKVYYNAYGYGGLLQWDSQEGYWIYERGNVYDPSLHDHFRYVNGTWEPYYPTPTQKQNIHILSAFLDALLETGHTVLDIAGFIPVIGEPADGINALIYFGEGDIVNGSLSTVAIIPFWGLIPSGSKLIRNAITVVKLGGEDVLKSNKGIIYYTRTYGAGVGTESSLNHILRHTKDVVEYPDGTEKAIHGIFDDKNDIVGLIDEGFEEILNGSTKIAKETELSQSKEYIIDMGRVIGHEGGAYGSGNSLTHLKIVIARESGNETNKIITSFPIKQPE